MITFKIIKIFLYYEFLNGIYRETLARLNLYRTSNGERIIS